MKLVMLDGSKCLFITLETIWPLRILLNVLYWFYNCFGVCSWMENKRMDDNISFKQHRLLNILRLLLKTSAQKKIKTPFQNYAHWQCTSPPNNSDEDILEINNFMPVDTASFLPLIVILNFKFCYYYLRNTFYR